MSTRSSLLGSHAFPRDGFQQIPEQAASSRKRNDSATEIPLTMVASGTAARRNTIPRSYSPVNEKSICPRGQGGRRKQHDDGQSKVKLTGLGPLYQKILNFSVLTRYLVYILPVAIILAVPIVIGATLSQAAEVGAPNPGDHGVRVVWIFTWVEIVWLSLWVSKLFAKMLPRIFQVVSGIISAGTRKYALLLTALEIPISLVGWALASLATFMPLMTNNPDQRRISQTSPTNWESVVERILAAFMIASLVWLAEKFLIQLISMSYHRTQYEARIKRSKHDIYLTSLLYDSSRRLFPAYCSEFQEEDYEINDGMDLGHTKRNPISGSGTPMRILQDLGRFGDKVTAAFGNVAQEITGKSVFNPDSAHSIVVEALEKSRSSEALAKRIWMSFVVEGKEALYQEDIVEVLGEEYADDAEDAFLSLDQDGNGDVSLDEMILAISQIGRDRRDISSSLHDVDQALNVLDDLLATVVGVVVIFVFVAFLNSSFTTTLATAGTALLSLSFVFASTAAEVLGSCIFIFVKHPFDIGDRVDINGQCLVVERISLLYSVFHRVDDYRLTQVPNAVLSTMWIDNISRSNFMRERLAMFISFDTSLENIQLLRDEMQRFVLEKDNARDFQPDIEVEVAGLAEMNKLELKVEIRHKSNWSNEAVRASRRSKFMCALVLALRRVPIYAPGGGAAPLGSADQPAYSVSITDEQASAARAAFTRNQEATALSSLLANTTSRNTTTPNTGAAPTPAQVATNRPSRSATITSPTETTAFASLTQRNRLIDTANDLASPAHATSSEAPEPIASAILRRQSTRGKRRSAGSTSRKNSMSSSTITLAQRHAPPLPAFGEPTTDLYRTYGQVSMPPAIALSMVPTSVPTSDYAATHHTIGNGSSYVQLAPRYDAPPTPHAPLYPPPAVTFRPSSTASRTGSRPGTSGRDAVTKSGALPVELESDRPVR